MNRARLKERLLKLGKPLLDLIIVITGVSVAFLLNSWNETKKENAERVKVFSSLQTELQGVKKFFPSFASYQLDRIREWDSLKNLNQWSDFYQYRFIQPQYNYEVISYALETRNSNIVSFDLHERLLVIYNTIKRIEQAEIYMTELALQYYPQNAGPVNHLQTQRNMFLFDRFIGFARDRAAGLKAVSNLTDETLALIELEDNN